MLRDYVLDAYHGIKYLLHDAKNDIKYYVLDVKGDVKYFVLDAKDGIKYLVVDMYYGASDAHYRLRDTFALTLIKQIPLVAGLAVMVGFAAR